MTITLNWNATSARDNRVIAFTESKTIYIWAPTALTSLSTFQATVAGVCMVGICGLCCIGCLNSVGVSSLRRFNVLMARETRDQQECEQNRVFNPMWMPCAPSQPGYYNIESTPNSVLLMQRRREIKSLILRTPTTFSLMDRLTRAKYLKSSDYVGCFGFQLPWATAPPRRLVDSSSEDEFPAAMPIAARRGSRRGPLQANQFREVSMMRQQLRARPSVQLPPNYSQQRAPSYNWPQVQAQTAMYNPQNQMYPGAPNYPQQTAQAQAQGAMYINQNQMYLGAPNYPQQTAQAQAAMYNPQNQMYPGALNNPQQTAQAPAMNPGNQYDMSQSPGAPRNRLNYETITVGFAFIHHRFAQDVPSDAKPLSKETPGTEDFDPCEAQGAGHGARLPGERAQHRKGKEPMSDGSSLEQSRSGCQDTILHSFLPRISLNPTTKLNFHHSASIQEIVTGSSESGSVRSERDVSELQKLDVLPREELELQGDERSEDSDRASESFGSPLTDLYEDVLESCSSSNTTPERIDATCRRESPLAPVQPSSEH
ncbi:hypothetical protein KC19_10G083100 [Ceratodon purpureus]|uniref:Uncharacterized protein n=1 Tax=Ceratodon purpureus TaxID=3225 RepID=A0A8T0GLV0_CERPU|nr:hypothetical protein KC19_10G083100 [Ceratodon purpureus]